MYLLTPPTAEPVTTDEAMAAARLTAGDALASVIPGHIAAARQVAEQEAGGNRWMQQTWRIELEDWPAADEALRIHRPSALAIAYWTGATWSTLATNAYVYFPLGNWTAIAPALNTSWPTLGQVAGGPRVRVDMTVGAANAATVPECVKLFIKALVAHWVDSPQAAHARTLMLAPFLRSLLDPVRLWGD